jgi:DNA-binding Lrp family transcriptional regulator
MLVKISSKLTANFIKEVKNKEGVIDVYPVFGRFDAVVFIEGKNFPEMNNVVLNIIQTNGIRSTETFTEAI